MSETNKCPCCPRGCDLSDPHCSRGEEYAKTGIIPQKGEGSGKSHEHDHEHEHGHHHGHGHGHDHKHKYEQEESGGQDNKTDSE